MVMSSRNVTAYYVAFLGAAFFISSAQADIGNNGRRVGGSSWTYGRSQLAFSLPTETVFSTKQHLLTLAKALQADSKTGVFLSNPSDRSSLKKAAAELEAVAPESFETTKMLGDWTLVCTASFRSGNNYEQTSKRAPFSLKNGGKMSNPIQDALKRSFTVTQRIRSMDNSTDIDRVDNVVEFTPANTLDQIFGSTDGEKKNPLQQLLGSLNLNPLEVSKSKASLIHSAEVQSTLPVLRTRIGLKSVVLNVAGTSQYLDPIGADILGANVPLGEFLNAGYFDTTYVDDDLRISRSKIGLIEQLRVFVRKGSANDLIANPFPKANTTSSNTTIAITDVMREASNDAASAARDVQSKVEGAINKVLEKVEEEADVVAEKVTDVVMDVGEVVETVQDAVVNVTQVAKESVEEIQTAIQGGTEDVAEVTVNAIMEVEETIEESLPEEMVTIIEDVEEIMETVGVGIGNVTTAVDSSVEEGLDNLNKAVDALEENLEDIEWDELDGDNTTKPEE